MDTKLNSKKVIFSTPLLKVLDFLLSNPDLKFSDSDVNRMKIGVKKSAINSALRTLASIGLIERGKQGQMSVNGLIQTKPIVSYLKIVSNLLTIEPLIKKCAPRSYKIILFGSRADGTNSHDSDFDVLVVADDKSQILELLQETRISVQIIVKLPEEIMRLHETEPALWDTISKGIILWEKT